MAISTEWTTDFAAYTHSENHECCALITLKAPEIQESSRRAPVDMVAVIDKSGSMAGVKLDMVKKTLEIIINDMEECDRLSLVTYDTHVYRDFPLTYMNDTNKESTKQAVNNITPGSSTNLCDGLVTGMKEIVSNTIGKGSVATVLLMTDGLANQGTTGKADIKKEMQKIIDPQDGKPFYGTVNTFGYGSDHDSDLLQALVYGGGMYHFISSIDEVANFFAVCVGGVMSTVGQKITLELEVDEVYLIKNIHTYWPVTWITPQKKCEISVGDLQSEEQRDILVELVLPALPRQQHSHKALTSKLDYIDVISSSSPKEPLKYSLNIKRTSAPKGESSKRVDSQRNRIITFETFQKAKEFADRGEKSSAQQALKDTADLITSSVSGGENFSQTLLADLRKASDIVTSDLYRTQGSHFITAMMQSHAQQRSNYSDENSLYTTTKKIEYIEKAIRQRAEWRTSVINGCKLFVYEWKPKGDIKAVLHICHGTYEYMGRYRLLGEHLKDNGILVRAFDLVGHGRSQGNRENIKSNDSYVTDVVNHIKDTKKEFSLQPVFLMGHSEGGVIAIGVALRIQEKLAGLVLSAPAMANCGRIQVLIKNLFGWIAPRAGSVTTLDGKFVSSVQDEVVAYKKDRLIQESSRAGQVSTLLKAVHAYKPLLIVLLLCSALLVVLLLCSDLLVGLLLVGLLLCSSGWASALLKAERDYKPLLDQITIPVLIMHGTNDELVPITASSLVINNVASSDKAFETFVDSRHEVLHDKEQEKARQLILEWLLAKLK